MKADNDADRVCAFTKRVLQQSLSGPSPHAAASLFLLSHVAQEQQPVAALLHQYAKHIQSQKSSQSGEDDEDKNKEEVKEKSEVSSSDEEEESGAQTAAGKAESTEGEVKVEVKEYDPHARDPRSANATQALLWELDLYQHHFHPSVKAFGDSLSSVEDGYSITYEGDPLIDFSTIAFLDRIVYKQGIYIVVCLWGETGYTFILFLILLI